MHPITLILGLQQDCKGRFYRIGRFPSGRPIRVEGGNLPAKPFSLRFVSDNGGHLWEYPSEGESKVHSCGQPKCAVCGEHGLVAKHRIITQEEQQ